MNYKRRDNPRTIPVPQTDYVNLNNLSGDVKASVQPYYKTTETGEVLRANSRAELLDKAAQWTVSKGAGVDEAKWAEAKASAAESKGKKAKDIKGEDYALVQHIYRNKGKK